MTPFPDIPPLPLTPHGNHVLVVPLDDEPPKGHGGVPLILPASVRRARPPQRGVCVAVGNGIAGADGSVPDPPCRPGTMVAFKRHAGTDLTWGSVALTVMRFDEVYAEVVD